MTPTTPMAMPTSSEEAQDGYNPFNFDETYSYQMVVSTVNEALLALAVTDLPFTANEPNIDSVFGEAQRWV